MAVKYTPHSPCPHMPSCRRYNLHLKKVQKSIDKLTACLAHVIQEPSDIRVRPVLYEIHGSPQEGFTLAITRLQLSNGKEVGMRAPKNPDRAMQTLLRPDSPLHAFLVDNYFTEVLSPTGVAYSV